MHSCVHSGQITGYLSSSILTQSSCLLIHLPSVARLLVIVCRNGLLICPNPISDFMFSNPLGNCGWMFYLSPYHIIRGSQSTP